MNRDWFFCTATLVLSATLPSALAVEIAFEHSDDTQAFETYSEQLGLILWNGEIGAGGSGGASASNRTDFTHPESFALDDVGDASQISIMFKTANFTGPATSDEFLASIHLSSSSDGPRATNFQYSATFGVGRNQFGTFHGVSPRSPPLPTEPILPYIEASIFTQLAPQHWYELQFTVTRLGEDGLLRYDALLLSRGATGLSLPTTVASESNTLHEAFKLSDQAEIFGGFSVGGQNFVSAFDNFKLTIPEAGPPKSTIQILPSADAQLKPGNLYPLGELNATELDIDGGSGSQFPRLDVLLEFPLAELPASAELTSVTLNLDPLQSATMVIEVLGYAADGVLALSDEFATTELLGMSGNSISGSSNLAIELDREFLQSMLGQVSHLGLRLKSKAVGPYTRIASMESATGTAPYLEVEYVLAGLPGDFNSDGQVNLADYTVWRDLLGATGDDLAADGNGDSVVDGLDYAVWKENFGQIASSPESLITTSVPEPANGIVLILISSVLHGVARRRKIRFRQRVSL